jgi:hypothetical protein
MYALRGLYEMFVFVDPHYSSPFRTPLRINLPGHGLEGKIYDGGNVNCYSDKPLNAVSRLNFRNFT